MYDNTARPNTNGGNNFHQRKWCDMTAAVEAVCIRLLFRNKDDRVYPPPTLNKHCIAFSFKKPSNAVESLIKHPPRPHNGMSHMLHSHNVPDTAIRLLKTKCLLNVILSKIGIIEDLRSPLVDNCVLAPPLVPSVRLVVCRESAPAARGLLFCRSMMRPFQGANSTPHSWVMAKALVYWLTAHTEPGWTNTGSK